MKSRLELILSMLIFGTIGLFVRAVSLPSAVLAMARGVIGGGFLLLLLLLTRKRPALGPVKAALLPLLLSGAFLGLNWVMLFESYRYTTVAVATICYYLAPVFVLLASPIVCGERLTLRRGLAAVISVFGMVLVSGITGQSQADSDFRGILFGLAAAFLYAAIVLINKKMPPVDAYPKTIVQLFSSSAVLTVYLLFTDGFVSISVSVRELLLVLLLGILHTGIAYALYFTALGGSIGSQTAAILSYIDPASAILLSALFLKEPLTLPVLLGTVLILGAAVFSELPEKTGTDPS